MKPLFDFFSSRRLGPLERRLLHALWTRGSATVRELREDGYGDLAYTTLMTTLDRLFKKGLLSRSEEGRAFRYAPGMTREALHREVATHAVRQWMDASAATTLPLSFLVEMVSGRDAKLLDELDKLIEEKRQALKASRLFEGRRFSKDEKRRKEGSKHSGTKGSH